MARGYSVAEALLMKKKSFQLSENFFDAFGEPEMCGVWFIWGNSGNGKSSFVMQLCKELCKHGKVAYNSLEEGTSLTMQNTLNRFAMDEVNRRMMLLDGESVDELTERLLKKKSPDFVIIDSFQYTQMSYKQYLQFKAKHRKKLLIFISHADGKQPSGRSAKSVMYDASLKIWVEGYRAFSKGRFIGPNGGTFTVWDAGAERFWGENLAV
jgi:hypothetical protein